MADGYPPKRLFVAVLCMDASGTFGAADIAEHEGPGDYWRRKDERLVELVVSYWAYLPEPTQVEIARLAR